MKILAALFLALCLAACAAPTPIPPVPNLTFAPYPPIRINASRIEVTEEYVSPMRAPNIEHSMPMSPADAMQFWVRDRLRANGTDKLLQVIIKDASVIATDLPKKGGFEGFFTNDQDKRFDAKLSVELRLYGSAALSEASAEATATRSVTLPESASVAARKAAYQRLVYDLMQDINAELEKNIYRYMGNHLANRK